MDRSAGGDGDLPDLAVTAEIESKSKSKIRQSFQGSLIYRRTAESPRSQRAQHSVRRALVGLIRSISPERLGEEPLPYRASGDI
jgi:hypothetical protein